MGVFDIIGPIMIGPSSSHTAGAVKLGEMARNILGEKPKKALITLYGSFAQTYMGHGTDKALVAGLLGYSVDDFQIKDALTIAKKTNIKIVFEKNAINDDCHPNTAKFCLDGISGRKVSVIGSSIGGGKISIDKINRYDVHFSGEYYTLLIDYYDRPGIISKITQVLAQYNLNIAFMQVSRYHKGADALSILQMDQAVNKKIIDAINSLPDIKNVLTALPL